MSEDLYREKSKKAAVVVLIHLEPEARTKRSVEIEASLREVLQESFAKIPWLVLKSVVVAQE
jgi:hypothetical protein